jgi:hypothetical protein
MFLYAINFTNVFINVYFYLLEELDPQKFLDAIHNCNDDQKTCSSSGILETAVICY